MKINSDFASRQGEHFDNIVTLQGGRGDVLKENRALTLEFEAIVRLMGNLSGKKVLDIGCGYGRHSLKIARMAAEVTGVDISRNSIDLANPAANKIGIKKF